MNLLYKISGIKHHKLQFIYLLIKDEYIFKIFKSLNSTLLKNLTY